jgi:hypothetical protein
MSAIPENHVFLPAHPTYDSAGGDYTIREIQCLEYKTTLCSIVIADVHQARLVWPFRVVHLPDGHKLVPRVEDEPTNALCKGWAAKGYEAEAYLKKYMEIKDA